MKVLRNELQLRIVGKGWQVKAKLRELSKSNITLKEYLKLYS